MSLCTAFVLTSGDHLCVCRLSLEIPGKKQTILTILYMQLGFPRCLSGACQLDLSKVTVK